MRTVLDDLLDGYDVVDISVGDPPLEQVISEIYGRPDVNRDLAGLAARLRRTIHQPGDLAVRVAFFAIILVVIAALWSAAIDANGGSLHGYDPHALLWYVLPRRRGARCAAALDRDHRRGHRLRHRDRDAAARVGGGAAHVDRLGEACGRLVASFRSAPLIMWLYVGAPPTLPALALAVPAVVLGCAANLASSTPSAASRSGCGTRARRGSCTRSSCSWSAGC